MAQLTVYVDETTFKRIEMAAKHDHESISKWVKKRLAHAFLSTWPDRYFELFGSLAEESLERPRQGKFSHDVRREKL